jgi:septal ring factor EnvC (AmiA/AmiB activator)
MSRIGARLVLMLALMLGLGAAGLAHAQVKTLWNCKDPSGRTTLTDQKADTVGKDCRVVHEERVSVVPAAKVSAKSPAGFPRESAADRQSSKATQRDTIEKELNQEQSMLTDARKKLSEQEAIRSGNEQNYAKVLERLRPYQDTVEVHQKNVEALKRELGNLSR